LSFGKPESANLREPNRGGSLADSLFEDRRLAELYDPLDPDRSDLDAYLTLADELDARSVLDVGCATGTLACLLACQVDLVTMTGNVTQVFLSDDGWLSVLRSAKAALAPGGRLVFEVRDPGKQAWREWNRDRTYKQVSVAGVGTVETWVELTAVAGQLVSFRTTFVFAETGEVITSDSTLRFRPRDEIEVSLAATGLLLEEVRDAPIDPGGSSCSSPSPVSEDQTRAIFGWFGSFMNAPVSPLSAARLPVGLLARPAPS
jgi:SAM-dependent methyltransferase